MSAVSRPQPNIRPNHLGESLAQLVVVKLVITSITQYCDPIPLTRSTK